MGVLGGDDEWVGWGGVDCGCDVCAGDVCAGVVTIGAEAPGCAGGLAGPLPVCALEAVVGGVGGRVSAPDARSTSAVPTRATDAPANSADVTPGRAAASACRPDSLALCLDAASPGLSPMALRISLERLSSARAPLRSPTQR